MASTHKPIVEQGDYLYQVETLQLTQEFETRYVATLGGEFALTQERNFNRMKNKRFNRKEQKRKRLNRVYRKWVPPNQHS